MLTTDIRRIVVAGAGAIGQYIAVQCLRHEFDVCLYDVDPNALCGAAANHCERQRILGVSEEVITVNGSLLEQLQVETHLETAAAGRDLLIEAVPEKSSVKRDLFARFHQASPRHTLFATTTSSFLPAELAEWTGRPGQFAALHFLLDADIVEIMGHSETDPGVLDQFERFSRSIGHIPIRCHTEQRGYLFNTLVMAMNSEAIRLAANGVAHIADIDRAWMRCMRTHMGPFGLLDLVGLDTALEITRYFATISRDPQSQRNAEFLAQYVDQGRLGIKSGSGFYDYPHPAYQSDDFFNAATGIL